MHAPEEMLSRMTEMLDLDENQSQSIRNIVDAAKPQFDSLRERSRANRDALRDLDINDPDYNAKLQNLSAESGQLASEMTLLHGQVRRCRTIRLRVHRRRDEQHNEAAEDGKASNHRVPSRITDLFHHCNIQNFERIGF